MKRKNRRGTKNWREENMSTKVSPIMSRSSNLEDSVSQGRCAVCGVTNNLLRCSRCKTIKYCTKEHQIIDWRHHKAFCSSKANDIKTNSVKFQINPSTQSAKPDRNYSGVLKNGIVSPNLNSNVASEMSRIKSAVSQARQRNIQYIQDLERQIERSLSGGNSVRAKRSENSKNPSAGHSDDWTMPITYAGSSEDTILEASGQSLNPSVNRIAKKENKEKMDMARKGAHNNHHGHHYHDDDDDHDHHDPMDFPNVKVNSEEDYLRYVLRMNPDSHEEFIIDEISRNLIRDMNQFGVCVVDSFLGHDKGLSVLNDVLNMYIAGMFKDGQLVANKHGRNDLKTIRGDQITWLDGKENYCENVGMLISKVDSIIMRANRMANNGKFANYTINERTKAMVACYPGCGSHYVKHVDNPNRDGRCITAIYYVNRDWDIKEYGGLLRIFPEGGRDQVADIAPLFDRILFFWSDRRNPHEVQPAFKTRYAITLWYFDAEERSEACRRYQMDKSVQDG